MAPKEYKTTLGFILFAVMMLAAPISVTAIGVL